MVPAWVLMVQHQLVDAEMVEVIKEMDSISYSENLRITYILFDL